MNDPKVAKNPIIKKYNFILLQHKKLQFKLSKLKDDSQKRAFMTQGYYKKVKAIIIKMFESMDSLILSDSSLWAEAIRICKDPRDYNDKKIKDAGFDLDPAIADIKGFYIEEKKSTEKVVSDKKPAKKAKKVKKDE